MSINVECDIDQLMNDKGFKIIHLNIQSLLPKFGTIKTDLLSGDLDVISFSETWLKNSIPDGLLHVSNYDLIRYDRKSLNDKGLIKTGGGLCVYIKNGINYDDESLNKLNLSNGDIEAQFIIIKGFNAKKIILINCYRPPSGNAKSAIEHLLNALNEIENILNYEIVLLGDMNLDCLNAGSGSTALFSSICNEFQLKNVINLPTRFSENRQSCIDIILTNIHNIYKSGTVNYNISDHIPIFMIKKRIHDIKQNAFVYGRSYKHYDKEAFMKALTDYDWSSLEMLDEPDKVWEIIKGKILAEIDKTCPLKKLKINVLKPEWLSLELTEMAHERDRLARVAKCKNTPESWKLFKDSKNAYNKAVKKAQNEYTLDQLERHSNDHKNFWQSINKIIPKISNKNINNVKDPVSGRLCDTQESCDLINEFFTNIGPTLSNMLPKIRKPYTSTYSQIEMLDIELLSEEDMLKLINGIKIYKSSGIPDISSRLLKDALLAIPKQVTFLFNLSLNKAIFPESWKTGFITPIPKKGDITDINNIRPIAITPILGKLLEKHVTANITKFLEDNKLLNAKQGGFRKNCSTIKTNYQFIQDLALAKNKNKYSIAVFLDLCKAFDCVNHEILLEKLYQIGIRGNYFKWISSYLTNRKQVVKLNGVHSKVCTVKCGVPQGSVIGPLLFLIYINDIGDLSLHSKLSLFADDTVIYCQGENVQSIVQYLQEDLNTMYKWCIYNKLTINANKTKCMVFGNSFKKPLIDDPKLYIDNSELQFVNNYEYLGVVIDPGLNFKQFIAKVFGKVGYKLHLLSLLRKKITTKCAVTLYKTMILPYFEYGNVFLLSCTEFDRNKLQRLQNRCLRVVFRRDNYSNVFELHMDAHLLPLKMRQIISLLKLMFQESKNISLLSLTDVHTRIRNGPLFKVPKPNSERFKRSISYLGPTEWNKLPIKIRIIEDKCTFYSNIMNYFWKLFADNQTV